MLLTGHVGLLNQGATCYLNSLLQCMYMTPELRAGLYALSDEELGVQFLEPPAAPAADGKDQPSAATAADEVEISPSQISKYTDMGFEEHVVLHALRQVSCLCMFVIISTAGIHP